MDSYDAEYWKKNPKIYFDSYDSGIALGTVLDYYGNFGYSEVIWNLPYHPEAIKGKTRAYLLKMSDQNAKAERATTGVIQAQFKIKALKSVINDINNRISELSDIRDKFTTTSIFLDDLNANNLSSMQIKCRIDIEHIQTSLIKQKDIIYKYLEDNKY